MPDSNLVYIIDDDPAVRDSLGLLMTSVGLASREFGSASDFLDNYDPSVPSCLVADIRMPGMSGLELQQVLLDRQAEIRVIFITGHGDVPMAITAMKAGALDFIQKPFRDQELLDRINSALQKDHERREFNEENLAVQDRIGTLTAREKEVLDKVVEGCANKVIAMDLGVSKRTVEIHRARVMQKMGVRSLAQLVRITQKFR